MENPDFKFELELFSLMMQRNKKAHSRTKYYKQLMFVEKYVDRIKKLSNSVNDNYLVIINAKHQLLKAYSILRCLASQTYFLSISLSFMAILARIFVYYQKMLELLESESTIDKIVVESDEKMGQEKSELLSARDAIAMITRQTQQESYPTIVPRMEHQPKQVPKTKPKQAKVPRKPKKRGLDEIDDIFGGL